jgi:hypothetical protein
MRYLMTLSTAALCLGLASGAALSDEPMITALSEDSLRAMVPFGPEDVLKLAECEDARFLTCTHIWGPPDSDDATRIAAGGKPSGSRITVIAAESARESDFDRVLSSYSDAVPIEGFGPQAVWSASRAQLSLRTADGRIIHVNVADIAVDDLQALAMAIAQVVVAQP